MTERTVWVLADDRAGNVAQALGIAEALGAHVETKTIRYTKWIVLPNVIRGRTTIGITKESVEGLTPPYPDIAIAAGRRAAPLLRYIKKMSQGKTKIVQIMYPGYFGLSDYDLVVLPQHDGFQSERPNVMRVIGAPHRVTEQKLEMERQKWAPVFETLPRPYVSLIVGGATKDKPFTVEMAKDLAEKSKKLLENLGGGSFLVTTSRRTGVEQEKLIRENLSEPMFFYEWGNKQMDNPYFGFLAVSDHIIVTGDSVSMCSEACASAAPVYIYAPEGSVSKKHAELHRELYDGGYASPLDGTPKQSSHERLNVALDIAERLKKLG